MVCFANKIITVQTIQLAGETKKIVKNLKRNGYQIGRFYIIEMHIFTLFNEMENMYDM